MFTTTKSWRISVPGSRATEENCKVVIEAPVTLAIERVGEVTLMCTPVDIEALALGFLRSEGYVSTRADIGRMSICLDESGRQVVHAEPTNPAAAGWTGGLRQRAAGDMAAAAPICHALRVSGETLVHLAEEMRERQQAFRRTGGSHAAAVFAADGTILSFAEDIGRCNALDKSVGKLILAGRLAKGCGVMLSGRVNYEIVGKAARAGIELIAAVSAPTSLAIEAAEKSGLTLCAFVRDDRVTVFTHRERVVEAV